MLFILQKFRSCETKVGSYWKQYPLLDHHLACRPCIRSSTVWNSTEVFREHFKGLQIQTGKMTDHVLSLKRLPFSAEISDEHNVMCLGSARQRKLPAIGRKSKSKDEIGFEIG